MFLFQPDVIIQNISRSIYKFLASAVVVDGQMGKTSFFSSLNLFDAPGVLWEYQSHI